MPIHRFLTFLIFTWISLAAYCQTDSTDQEPVTREKTTQYHLKLQYPEPSPVKLKFKESYSDSLQARKALTSIVSELHEQAYLLAGIDSVSATKNTLKAWLYIGERFEWASVKPGNVSEQLARKAGFKERWFTNKPLRPSAFLSMEKALIQYSINHGYPFATVKLDSVHIEGQQVSGVLHYQKNSPVIFDSIKIVGKSKVHPGFLQNYLQIKPGAPFDQRKLDQVKKMIQQLKAVKLVKPYQIRFRNEQAQVVLFLEDRKTNTVDGIVGFQQNPNPLINTILLTGQFDLGLNNVAGRGKSIEMHWKKTDASSQLLNLSYEHLSLFGSGFHGKTRFEMFKQDTTFQQVKPYVEFFRNHPALGKLKFFYQLDDARTIGKQTILEGIIPSVSSTRTNYYGLGIEWDNLDQPNFARKGWLIDINGSVGNKRILNSDLNSNENLESRSLQLKADALVEKNIRINKYLGMFTRVHSGWIENENLFLNELYRLGGIQSLRGFREYTFYASNYAIGSLEGRFFLDDQSYLLLFSDYAWYQNNIASDEKPLYNGAPLGIGGGITFSTRTGVFSFIYAIGKEGSNPINFNNSVINFGLTSRF